MSSNSVLTYLLSLIGIIPINQHQLQQQQQRQLLQLQQQQPPSSDKEEKCQLLASSAFVVQQDQDEQLDIQDWLGRLSKMALCQILSTTIADYPQVADNIYTRHYEKNYRKKKRITPNIEVEKLKSIQAQARSIAHELDNQRPSEQFGRADETANALQQMVRSLHIHSDQSFLTLFGLIIIAQESLSAPSENFNYSHSGSDQYWRSLMKTSWLADLQEICSRLSRYDITWEYRKEYSEVAIMAERYHH
ncbi:hypothetical protein MBANPS3_011342 [Mucor bainieri]